MVGSKFVCGNQFRHSVRDTSEWLGSGHVSNMKDEHRKQAFRNSAPVTQAQPLDATANASY